jgi:hypothetical protein
VRARSSLPADPKVATAFPLALSLLLVLALEFDCTRQFSVPFRFPLAFPVTFQATAQALAIAFQVVPIEVEVLLLASECDVGMGDPIVVVKRIDATDGRPILSELAKVALRLAF